MKAEIFLVKPLASASLMNRDIELLDVFHYDNRCLRQHDVAGLRLYYEKMADE